MHWRGKGAARGFIVLLAVAIVATACDGTDDTADTAAETTATSQAIAEGSAEAADRGPDVDLRPIFEANGITIIDAPDRVEQVDGFQLWSYQVENMEREIANGSGVFGFELDRAAGAPSGMPFSYLVAGWITAADTPAADAAVEIMGDQPWEFAPSLIYPNAVLVLFVADSLIAEGAIGTSGPSAEAGGPRFVQASQVLAQGGLCSELSEWVTGVLDWIFEGLKFEEISDRWYGWAQRVWNGAVDLARGIVETGIELVSEVVLAPIRKALAVVGTVSMVVTHLQPWTADIRRASASAPELAVGDQPDVVDVASVFVSTGIRDPWPDLVKDCASVAGLELPDPTSTAGSKVEWSLEDGFPKNRASIVDADEEVGTNNHATMRWTPGRDEGDAPFPGWINLAVTVEKNQIDQLQEMLIEFFVGAIIPAGDHAGRVKAVVEKLTAPVWEALLDILEVTDRERVTVIHHEDVQFEYPVDDLETYDDATGGLIQIDIGRATATNEGIFVSGHIDTGPFTGHPDFTIWLAPSGDDCRLQTGVAFASNPADCTFTVEDGPDFLVGKVLAADEINGTPFYSWNGVEDADAMFTFVGISEPRCLDLAWYFRIFETGVMLGYPKGLTRDEEIDVGAPPCVVLSMSNTTEYTTNP